MKILVLTGTQEAEVSKILHRLNKTPGLHEEDYNIKDEIYTNFLQHKDVLFVVDDRKQVVDMWRSKGLTVLQCAEGNF